MSPSFCNNCSVIQNTISIMRVATRINIITSFFSFDIMIMMCLIVALSMTQVKTKFRYPSYTNKYVDKPLPCSGQNSAVMSNGIKVQRWELIFNFAQPTTFSFVLSKCIQEVWVKIGVMVQAQSLS